MIVDVADAPRIDLARLGLRDPFQHRIHLFRQAEPAGEIDASAARQQAKFGCPAALVECLQQPIRHLAGGAVAAGRDHQIEAAGREVERQPFGVTLGLRLAQLEFAEMLVQRRGDLRPMPFQPAATGNRIEHHPDFQRRLPKRTAGRGGRRVLCRH